MLRKKFDAEFKALTAEDGATGPGEFEALVAVYDNVDREGDRVKSGAFDETLDAWRKAGDPIPVILEHQWGDPWAHIGYANPEDVKSVPGRGLLAKGVLDVEDNPVARQVHRLMERRTLKEFSFGYRVPADGEKKASDGAFDLVKLDLIEFGPCLKGVNESTELLAVKSAIEGKQRTGYLARGKTWVDGHMPGSVEEQQDAIADALNAAYADPANYVYVNVVATYPDKVVFAVCDPSDEGDEDDDSYEAAYTVADDGTVTLGDASPVTVEVVVTPSDTAKALTPRGKAWDGSAANYTDEEYAQACIVDRGADYSDSAKERYSVPIAKPGDSFAEAPDADALGGAAAALAGGRTPLKDVSAEQLKTAYERLFKAYRKLGEEPPATVLDAAGYEQPKAEEGPEATKAEPALRIRVEALDRFEAIFGAEPDEEDELRTRIENIEV